MLQEWQEHQTFLKPFPDLITFSVFYFFFFFPFLSFFFFCDFLWFQVANFYVFGLIF